MTAEDTTKDGASQVVLGVGASHTTLMNTKWDQVDHLDRAHAFRDGLATAKQALVAANPDLIVIVGSNHFRGFWLDMMPSFAIGVDEVIAVGEHGTPAGPQPVDPAAALAVHNAILDHGYDAAFSTKMHVDHGISHAIQYLVPDQTPTVPVVINCFAPPLPSLNRCLGFGDALRHALLQLSGDRRIAVIGTGGLSHQIPFPDWRTPEGATEEFFVESFREGRGRWESYEEKRRPLVVGAPAVLNTDFDDRFLADLESGHLGSFADRFGDEELVSTAGNGGNEVRAWLVMAAALDHQTGRRLVYSPMPEWLTGMAVAIVGDPSQPTQEQPERQTPNAKPRTPNQMTEGV